MDQEGAMMEYTFCILFAALVAFAMLGLFDLVHETLFGCYMYQKNQARWSYRATFLLSFTTVFVGSVAGNDGLLMAGIVVGWFLRSLYQYKVEGKMKPRFRLRSPIVPNENGT